MSAARFPASPLAVFLRGVGQERCLAFDGSGWPAGAQIPGAPRSQICRFRVGRRTHDSREKFTGAREFRCSDFVVYSSRRGLCSLGDACPDVAVAPLLSRFGRKWVWNVMAKEDRPESRSQRQPARHSAHFGRGGEFAISDEIPTSGFLRHPAAGRAGWGPAAHRRHVSGVAVGCFQRGSGGNRSPDINGSGGSVWGQDSQGSPLHQSTDSRPTGEFARLGGLPEDPDIQISRFRRHRAEVGAFPRAANGYFRESRRLKIGFRI